MGWKKITNMMRGVIGAQVFFSYNFLMQKKEINKKHRQASSCKLVPAQRIESILRTEDSSFVHGGLRQPNKRVNCNKSNLKKPQTD